MNKDEAFSTSSRWLGLPPRIALGFAAAIAAIGAGALFSFAALSVRAEKSALARHTAACQLAVEEVESALLNSDSSLDAYLAYPDYARLDRYESTRAKLGPALARLEALAQKAPDGGEILARLRPEIDRVRAGQARVLERSAAGDVEGARALYDGQVASAAIRRAHDALGELEELQERELVGRDALHAHTVDVANTIFIAAEALLLGLVLLGGRLVRDEIRARERAIAVQQRLVAMVSHDLRNPLCTVIGSTWSLARSELPDDARRALNRIRSAGRRMQRLVHDLLDWSRVHAGADIPVSVRDTDLVEVCARVAEELDDRSAARIQIAAAGDTRAPVDPDRIEQVLTNLIGNALQHAPGRPVRVRIAGHEDGVGIEVCDEGPGIAPEVRTHLFEPFRRSAGGREGDDAGVGLGLFIVRTIVEAHGGSIDVRTAPGQGTTFSVVVPRRTPRPARRGGPTPAQA